MQISQTNISPTELKVFQTIYEFVSNVYELYGEDTKNKNGPLHSLNLYHRLLVKIQFKDHESMIKYVDGFRQFCISNRIAIENKNWKMFTSNKIYYSNSKKIYLDIYWIFQKSLNDQDVTETCWKYLLTCSALLDDQSNAMKVLNDMMKYVNNNKGFDLNNMSDMLPQIMTLMSSLPNIDIPNSTEDVLKIFDLPQFKSGLSLIRSLVPISDSELETMKELVALLVIKIKQISENINKQEDKTKRLELLKEIINKL
jgi:hypothetical protein